MIPPPFRAAWLGTALFMTAALAACGNDSSGPNPGSHPAALNPSGDFDVSSYNSESSNLMMALIQAGFPLDTSSAVDSTSLAALLAGKDLYFVPEYTLTLDGPAQAFLDQWVEAGGTVVLVGGYRNLVYINAALGATVTTGDGFGNRNLMPKTDGAADTPFADGPASITGNNGGTCLDDATLPGSAKIAYACGDVSTDASVAVFPMGAGRIVYFGWDWYDGKPMGLQDGGWARLLRLTAGF